MPSILKEGPFKIVKIDLECEALVEKTLQLFDLS